MRKLQGGASMKKVHTENGYDFYIGRRVENSGLSYTIYNIVPEGAKVPEGGYRNRYFIERVWETEFPVQFLEQGEGT